MMINSKLWMPRIFIIFLIFQTHISHADDMNQYVLRAVDDLKNNHSNGGYDIHQVLSQNLSYDNGIIKATAPPKTMCVAAMLEVIILSINSYVAEHPDETAKSYKFLPIESWSRLRPIDIKSHIWVDPELKAYGTASALQSFGMGKVLKFNQLKPGDFANINRRKIPGHTSKPSGHAVVFLGYIDDSGNDLPIYSKEKVAGLKYFSNQSSTNGFGIKYGFFIKDGKWVCPTLVDRSKDCGIAEPSDDIILNAGRLNSPGDWNEEVRDKYLNLRKVEWYAKYKSKGADAVGMQTPSLDYEEFIGKINEAEDTTTLNEFIKNGKNL